MDRTPPELLDAIFSELHPTDWTESWMLPLDGKADLHACSLVSRSWKETAQRHLFRDITYSFRPTPGGPPNPPRSTVDFNSRDRTLPMFLHFLQHSPHFARYIRALRLELWPQNFPPPAHYSMVDFFTSKAIFEPTDVIDGSVLLTLLHSLPRLVALELCDINLAEDDFHPLHFPRLSLIHFSLLFYCRTHDIRRRNTHVKSATISKLLAIVAETKEFKISYALIGTPPPIHVSFDLRTEGVIPTNGFLFLLMASNPTFSRNIRRAITCVSYDCTEPSQRLISLIGEQLVELRIRYDMRQPENYSLVDLSRCRNIESCTLGLRSSLPLSAHGSMEESGLQAIRASIESFPQRLPRLRELTVIIYAEIRDNHDPLEWVAERQGSVRLLEQSLRNLMSRCTPPLEYVTFQSRTVPERECWAVCEEHAVPLTRAMFPELEREGKMRFAPLSTSVWRSFYNY